MQSGAALLEFAIAWPVVLLLVFGAVRLSLWAEESFAAREAALAGARAAAVSGGSTGTGDSVALNVLRPAIFGGEVVASCEPAAVGDVLQVCTREVGAAIDVTVAGTVPALLPLPVRQGLPIRAHVLLAKEVFLR